MAHHRPCPIVLSILTVLLVISGLILSSAPLPGIGSSPVAAQPSASCNDSADGPRILAAYTVKGSQLTHRKGTDCLAARRIWQRFAQLIPEARRPMVTRFELLAQRERGAEVFQNRNLMSWTLGVSLGLQPDLDYILIHEFAHLLTLRAEQVPPVTPRNYFTVERSCPTYFTGEGCSRGGSLINRFVQRYWPEQHQRISTRDSLSGRFPTLYSRFPGRFVNSYAATNPGEDIAEAFATFVTRERPAPNNVGQRKVNFFWNRPAMVQIRREIRARRI